MAVVVDATQVTMALTAAATFVATSAGWLLKYGRQSARTLTTLGQFAADWQGVPKRPGFAEVPAFPVRVENVEAAVTSLAAGQHAQAELLEAIRRELVANGGGSLRDQVRRIEQAQRAVQTAVGAPAPLPLPAAELAALALTPPSPPDQARRVDQRVAP